MGNFTTPQTLQTPQQPAPSGAGVGAKRRAHPWRRRFGIGCLGLLALVLAAGLIVWFLKPWAPTITVAEPGPGGQRVEGEGYLGNFYPAAPGAAGVVVWGGSEGGLDPWADHIAQSLHAEGYSVLAISYFGAEGQPDHIEAIPLEVFDDAIAWLQVQPGVAPGGVGVLGASKGGEAALLVASRNPDVRATIAYVPSSVAWQGFNLREPWLTMQAGSSWSADGAPVPYLPFGKTDTFSTFDTYAAGLADAASHPDAAIPIEQASNPVLLVCGGADTMWPSCEMSRQVEARAQERGGPSVTLLEYPNAGHLISGPPIAEDAADAPDLSAFGGTTEDNLAATKDSWPQVLALLEAQLP